MTGPQVAFAGWPREQLATGRRPITLAALLLLYFLACSPTHAASASPAHKDNPDKLDSEPRDDTDKNQDDIVDLSVLETLAGPFAEDPSARGCADFWAKHNLTRALAPHHADTQTLERSPYRDLTRLSYMLKRRLASHKNFALVSYVDRCQRVLAPPKRLLFFLNGAPGVESQSAAAQQVALLETLSSVDDSSRQAELMAAHSRSTNASRSIESILEEIERLKRRVVGFKQAQVCEESLASIAGGSSAISRFDELREERDRCRSELELCRVRGLADQNDLTFKLSEKDMELDICRKQSNRRLEIIKQATRMVDEMSKDMKERGIII